MCSHECHSKDEFETCRASDGRDLTFSKIETVDNYRDLLKKSRFKIKEVKFLKFNIDNKRFVEDMFKLKEDFYKVLNDNKTKLRFYRTFALLFFISFILNIVLIRFKIIKFDVVSVVILFLMIMSIKVFIESFYKNKCLNNIEKHFLDNFIESRCVEPIIYAVSDYFLNEKAFRNTWKEKTLIEMYNFLKCRDELENISYILGHKNILDINFNKTSVNNCFNIKYAEESGNIREESFKCIFIENINCTEPYISDYNYSSTIFNLLSNREGFNIYVTIPYKENPVC